MNTEPTKLPMRKLIDFMESRAQDPVPTNGKNFFQELLSIAEELEVEELTLLGDAHYDGMDQMRSLIDQQNLIENTNGYIKEKFGKELPDVDDDVNAQKMKSFEKILTNTIDLTVSLQKLHQAVTNHKMKYTVFAKVAPPIRDGNALFERATELLNVNAKP